jgi:hypothetical protein
MKIAVCYSGYIRTGAAAAPWHNHFFDGVDIDVFMHTWSVSKDKEWHPESFRYGTDKQKIIEENSIPKIVEFQNALQRSFVSLLVEDQSEWKKTAIPFCNHVSPLWYSWHKSIQLVKDLAGEASMQYDAIVKIRPDLIFSKNVKLVDKLSQFKQSNQTFYAMNYSETRIDDVLFIASPDIMYRASKFYHWIKELDCRWRSNIFAEYLTECGINVDGISYPAYYACIRPETQHLNTFDEIFWGEREYYAPKNAFDEKP